MGTHENDESMIRDIPDWTRALDRTDSPFIKMIGRMPEVGEKDRYGRTLLGYTEIDEEEKRRIHTLWSFKRDELEQMYDRQGFVETDDPDHAGYYEPNETPESLALKEEVNALWDQWRQMQPKPIWDREIVRSGTMHWGIGEPSFHFTIDPRLPPGVVLIRNADGEFVKMEFSEEDDDAQH